jgi:RNA polymerase sigma-70 factor, ECF subfamily
MSGEGALTVGATAEELALISRLRAGDERSFSMLVEQHSPGLLRLAMMYVPSRAVAEEVVQETWIGVLKGLDRFEGRSTLKTWIYRILTNTAKTRGQRESRSIPFSSQWDADTDPGEPSVDPDRFISPGHPEWGQWGNHWISSPRRWEDLPEQHLLGDETKAVIEQAIAGLPPAQREVITLRDVQGFGSDEVCDLLGLTEGNQRVLLHRGRSKVRRALEQYLDETSP